MNDQCSISITLKTHSLLSLVCSSVDGLTGSVLGSILHFFCLVGSILSSILDSVTGSIES